MRGGRWLVSRTTRLLPRCQRLWPRRGRRRLPRAVLEAWCYGRLLLCSLYFNSLTDSDTLLDCAFEPVYWLVDSMTRWFGVVFVCLVIVLTSSVLLIVYLCLLPLIVTTYPTEWVTWHLCYGHWNLLMVLYHYYKATTTSPGHPPEVKSDIPSVSFCRKCIVPKPARTHHCSICNGCILKMDHHCPWLNNCVGHFNHRYFFSFCLYMTMGCFYCSVTCRHMFFEAYNAVESYYQTTPPSYTFKERMFHKSVIYLWVLTSSVGVALGGLTLWHAILISRGETSIERLINRKEVRRCQENKKVFRNPYHYGLVKNWKVLFGVEKKSHWLTRVLLPSDHAPYGDGLVWESVTHRKDPMAI